MASQNKGRCPKCQSAQAQRHGVVEEPTDTGRPIVVGTIYGCTRCALAYVVTASEVYAMGDKVKPSQVSGPEPVAPEKTREVEARTMHIGSDQPWR